MDVPVSCYVTYIVLRIIMHSGLQVVFSDLSSLGFMIPTGFVPVFLKILGCPMLWPKITGFLVLEPFFCQQFPRPIHESGHFEGIFVTFLGQFIHQLVD